MAQQKVMKLEVPKDSENPIEICESCALTLLPGEDAKLYYYEGDEGKLSETNYSPAGLRKLLTEKKKQVNMLRGHDQFQVIIRPTKNCSMQHFVNVLDEMNICLVKRYFVDEPSKADLARLE